jgi:hypothetical protein|tara:strand:- start:115 stop:450 length:336 start_codon:yes stop_codon:yes gene_type:complete
MKQRSKRAKATRLQNFVRNKLLKAFPHLKKRDVVCVENYLPGPDIILSEVGKKLIPYQFEVKSQEKMKTIYQWHKQSSKGAGKLAPVVVCKMNTRDPLVILEFKHFIDLIK